MHSRRPSNDFWFGVCIGTLVAIALVLLGTALHIYITKL